MIIFFEDKIISKSDEIKPFSYVSQSNFLSRLLLRVTRYLRAKKANKYCPAKGKLLDIGCGDGYFLSMAKCREKYGLDKLLGDDVEDKLDFPDDFFDCITMLAVIEHIKHPQPLLAEIYRVLKPHGQLIITTPRRAAEKVIQIYNPFVSEEHSDYYSLDKIKQLTGDRFRVKVYKKFIFGLNQLFVLEKTSKK